MASGVYQATKSLVDVTNVSDGFVILKNQKANFYPILPEILNRQAFQNNEDFE
jgi:hypothetical protein